jgi:hypothetical protein
MGGVSVGGRRGRACGGCIGARGGAERDGRCLLRCVLRSGPDGGRGAVLRAWAG